MNTQSNSVVFHAPKQNQEQASVSQAQEQILWPQYIAEALGTFGLVFAGCGAIMVDTLSKGQLTHIGVALVFGLIITVMIYTLGHISGGHFNPAVTLALVLVNQFSKRHLLYYWASQLAGAILATLCLLLLLGNVASLGTTLPAGDGGEWQSFGMEVLLTFFLMIVIMAMTTDTRAVGPAAALAIGFTIMLEALFAGPISGASMNPARSLAPALVSGKWTAQWLYLTGPFLGAIAGAQVYRYLREASILSDATQHEEKESLPFSRDTAVSPKDSVLHEPAPMGNRGMENVKRYPAAPQTDALHTVQEKFPPETNSHANGQNLHGNRYMQERNNSISQNANSYENKAMPHWSNSTTETTPPNTRPMRVLFLCTHNSARSQMAEGLLRGRGGDAYQVFSAGTHPTFVHPLAIKAMWESKIDISTHRAKRVEEFIAEPPMDLVITVCDEAAEACPHFPNTRWQIHWSFPDPSQVTGSEEVRLAAFCYIRDLIAAKINQFPAHNPSSAFEQWYTRT